MDYMKLAQELLDVRTQRLRIPSIQSLKKIERGEICVLNYLMSHDMPIHPKDLSSAMGVSTARIATLLNQLEDQKHVQRIVDPDDKRQLIVVLTDAGREKGLCYRDRILLHIRDFLEELGPEDAEAYLRIEKKLWMKHLQEK